MSLIDLFRVASHKIAAMALLLVTTSYLAGCGGSDVTQNASYQVGGVVSGLVGTGLVLQDNGAGNLSVTADGAFHFATSLSNGSSYAVTVATQPTNPAQNCIVTSGTGTLQGADVTSIAVACSTDGFTVGGSVTGLAGSGLVLEDNGGDDLSIAQTGAFTFSQTVGSGVAYTVAVKTQPSNPTQTCAVTNPSGTIGSANVTNVAVSCSTASYSVSGTITGLVGTGLVLQTNGVTIPISGASFSVTLPSGTAYNVMVTTPPSLPPQTCVVANGSGTLTSANVSGVTVTCTTNMATVSGTITGLAGTGLALQSNGTSVPISGTTFAVTLTSGTAYNIAVTTQPSAPTQICAVANGSGTANANVSNVVVSCATQNFTVGGTISNLLGSGLALQTNGVAVPVTGSSFGISLASGSAYNIVVAHQPSSPAQTCVVANGAGTVTNANVSGVTVTCTSNNVTVSGTITGLAGTGLALQTNGTSVPISGSTFSVTLAYATSYNIVVTTQPSTPTQACTVANGSGTANANVSNVVVNCVTQNFNVSGTISNLLGTGLVLQNNGTTIPFSGSSFSVSLASGSAYNIVVSHQPSSPTQNCTVANGGPGTVTNANITNVSVTCVTTTFTISVNVTGLGAGATNLALFDNGGDSLAITSNSTFTFATAVASGQPYAVTVSTQPTATPAQYCIVQSGSGTVTNANITNVSLSCRTIGQVLVVANTYDSTNGDISSFTINPANGNLTAAAGSPYTANLNPNAVAIDPVGQYVYAPNLNSHDVSTYSLTLSTGALTPLMTAPGYPTSGALSFSVVVDPVATNFVFVGSDSGGPSGYVDFYTATSAVLALNGASPVGSGNDPLVMAADPTGAFLFATERYDDTINVYSITSGVLANVGSSPFTNGTGSAPVGVAVYPSGGYIYVAGAGNGTGNGTLTAYAYDGSTGALTPLTTLPYAVGTVAASAPTAVAIDPTGRFLYVTVLNDNTIWEFSIAPLTGLLTSVGTPIATGVGPADVKIEPSGQYLYVANSGDTTIGEYTIDPNTGALTAVTSGGTVVSGTNAQSIAIE